MKKYLPPILLLLNLTSALAQDLELKSMKQMVNDIENSQFTYKETGLVFGFFSIQSCLYVAQDMVIFKNYCFPKKNYLARSYTILSAKYGIVDIYQEKVDSLFQRDITQTEFSNFLTPYLKVPFPQTTVAGLNTIMETLYNQFNPGCWSTNWSRYTDLPDANCRAAGNVTGFATWSQETQELTGNQEAWNGLLETIEKKLVP